MARNLIAAGLDVTVWNRTPERARPLADAGARLTTDVAEAQVTPAVTQANPGIDNRVPAMEEPSLAGARHAPGVQIAEVVEVPTVEAEVPTVDAIEVKNPAKLRTRHLKANRTAKLGRTSVTKRKVAVAKKHENQKQAKTKLAGAGTATGWDAYPARPRHHLTAMR